VIIANNLAANATSNQLNKIEKKTSDSLSKLSSGLRINKAADDAAGLGISEKMRGQIRGLTQASKNIQNGISLVQVTDGALGQITDSLQRMRELAVQSSNGTLTDDDRKALQQEFVQLRENIGDIANNTEFNTIKLLCSPGVSETTSTTGGVSAPTSGEADIVFIIDTTSSMGSYIANVKSSIQSFADSLSSSGINIRLGLVAYGDTIPYDRNDGDGMYADDLMKYPFTDVKTFKDTLNYLPHYDGGDVPESGLEAIMDPTNGALTFPFRSTASKQFIVVTDADVHDNNDALNPGTFNIDAVASNLKTAGIKTTVVGTIGGNPQLEWSQITTKTGGSYFDITTDFSTLLSSYAETIVSDSGALPSDSSKMKMQILALQVGANTGDTYNIELFDARPKSLEIDSLAIDPDPKAQEAIAKLDDVTSVVSAQRAKFGAYQNALEHIDSSVQNADMNLTDAESRIRDVDMAKEMTEFQKSNILQQAAQAMLAQANQQPQGILQLLK